MVSLTTRDMRVQTSDVISLVIRSYLLSSPRFRFLSNTSPFRLPATQWSLITTRTLSHAFLQRIRVLFFCPSSDL